MSELVQRVASVMQEYTQSGYIITVSFACMHTTLYYFSRGVRPFGVSLLICGWDNDRPFLFQCDPSVRQ